MQAMVSVRLVSGITQAVFVLLLTRTLRVQARVIGLLLAAETVGGVGAELLVGPDLLMGRVRNRLGADPTLVLGTLATVATRGNVAVRRTAPGWTAVMAVVVFELAGSLGGTLMAAVVRRPAGRRPGGSSRPDHGVGQHVPPGRGAGRSASGRHAVTSP